MIPHAQPNGQEQPVGDQKQPVQRSGAAKRYSLVLPDELFAAVQELADRRQTTVVDIIRRCIKLGLIAARVEDMPGAALIIREGEIEREIIFV